MRLHYSFESGGNMEIFAGIQTYAVGAGLFSELQLRESFRPWCASHPSGQIMTQTHLSEVQ
jgi:hypothetical protein